MNQILSLGIVLLCFLIPDAGFAFESLPEFQSLTEAEQESFDDPTLLGPEYQSDILAFMKPPSWEYYWLSKNIYFDLSAGSISAVHFLIDTRVKLRGELNDWLQFRLNYFNERNHDRASEHLIPELVFRPWPWKKLGLSLYGEPTYAKRQNDVGLALLWNPSDTHEIRLFNTWVDVTRQKRSDRTDTFDEKHLPYARGLVGRSWTRESDEYFEYAFRYETRTKWVFKDERYDYDYWKGLASVFLRQRVKEGIALNYRLQLDRRFEARAQNQPGSPVRADAWRTDRVQAHLQADLENIPRAGWTLTPGFDFAHRRWVASRDELVYHDYLPHLWLKIPSAGEGHDQNYWQFQYDLTWHRKRGGSAIAHPGDTDKALNHRFNAAYSFAFKQKAELRLVVGLDLDAFGTGDTWEAGAGQFRIFLD